MITTDSIRETFFQECEDLIEALNEGLTSISENTFDEETIHSIFRAVHSIKGGAGGFGFDDLVAFAHEFETVLDEMRNGRLSPDEKIMDVFWQAADLLGDLIAASRTGGTVPDDRPREIIERLIALMPNVDVPTGTSDNSPSGDDAEFVPVALTFGNDDIIAAHGETSEPHRFHIRFRPHDAMFHNGNEAAILFRAVSELGGIEITCDQSKLPPFEQLEPEKSYLCWSIVLTTSVGIQEVRDVFEFVDQDCELEIECMQFDNPELDTSDTSVVSIAQSPEVVTFRSDRTGSLQHKSAVIPDVATPDPSTRRDAKPAIVDKPEVTSTVRVDVKRIDKLINLVGELVVNQAMLAQCVLDTGLSPASDFASGLDELKTLTRDVQDSVMSIRAQPVKPLFQRMSRIVREAGLATEKKVHFETHGEMTEIDKTVIEKLADPLTHMIRNAVDHGLETPEVREREGKAPQGLIVLTAAHRSGRVVINISDDGAGINREKVLKIATERGLVNADEKLSPEEIDALLFLPGFSTVDEVSNLSGRGVGMDVVRTSIRALGGRIAISSSPGKGSTFSISLPLTLAILDGMVVDVAGEKLIIPIASILETLLPNQDDIHPIGGGNVISVRQTFIPITDVGHALGFREKLTHYEDQVFILVETDEGAACAMAVDGIQDQRQLVIKALVDNYGDVSGIAAATILGDGRIALIVDPNDGIFHSPQQKFEHESLLVANG